MAKQEPPLDLLVQATTAPDEIGHPLVLGRSTLDSVLDITRIKRKSLIDRGDPSPGWHLYEADLVSFLFDANGVWQGFWYGISADELTWQVQGAVSTEQGLMNISGTDGVRQEPFPYPQITAGKLPIHLGGKDIRTFGTLPDFINTTQSVTPRAGDPMFPPPISWTLKARERDKWIALTTVLPHAYLSADFLLKAIKPEYQSRFVVDYCLYSIGIYTQAAASRALD
ncbi:hypothetical protein [Devosia aquimaris]|uniref:hypothetical protein n=1 Tax=Devosia aquimaris TaxID=2866214 RepID=UPI001CD0FBAF|nr:hypothetical protein [Devosia sp. CJK-A8-3]